MSKQSIYTVGGTVQAGGGIYIPRAADDELFQHCLDGNFCYVLTARQMGKSSLMVNVSDALAKEKVQTVLIDLTHLGTALRPSQWYLGLIAEIVSQLNLDFDYAAWWDDHLRLGPTQNMSLFLRQVVLEVLDAPIVIFVDEIDITLSLPFADDFFASIRACYNARGADAAYCRLSFVLLGVATPGDLIHDPKRTPFNIGYRIDLANFSRIETDPLRQGLGKNSKQILDWVFDWTNGHPYLMQRMCAELSGELITKPKHVRSAVELLFLGENGGKDHNLQFVRDMLLERSEDFRGVLEIYLRVLQGKRVEDDEQSINKSHLKLSGILQCRNGLLQISNRIYRQVFNRDWLREFLPRSRHKSSVLLWMVSIVSLMLLVILGSTGWLKNSVLLSIVVASIALTMVTILWFKRDAVVSVSKEAGRRVSETVRRVTQRVSGERSRPKALLTVTRGLSNDELKTYDIFGETPIGRDSGFAELVFDNPKISGLHCTLHLESNRWSVEDSNSSNGTFLNGKRLSPFQIIPLNDGDTIELAPLERGGIRFKFTLATDYSVNDGVGNADRIDEMTKSTRNKDHSEQQFFHDDEFDNGDDEKNFDPSAQEF